MKMLPDHFADPEKLKLLKLLRKTWPASRFYLSRMQVFAFCILVLGSDTNYTMALAPAAQALLWHHIDSHSFHIMSAWRSFILSLNTEVKQNDSDSEDVDLILMKLSCWQMPSFLIAWTCFSLALILFYRWQQKTKLKCISILCLCNQEVYQSRRLDAVMHYKALKNKHHISSCAFSRVYQQFLMPESDWVCAGTHLLCSNADVDALQLLCHMLSPKCFLSQLLIPSP